MSFDLNPELLPIRLLVVDEIIALGGIEKMWISLIPEFAKRCESVVWMIPSHRVKPVSSVLLSHPNVSFETFFYPHWNLSKLRSAILKRIYILFHLLRFSCAHELNESIKTERLESVIRKYRITHVLYPSLFNQPFPRLSVPVYGSVMDVNYQSSWRDECIVNLRDWLVKSECLFTISAFTKCEILKLYPAFRSKIVAIPLTTSFPSDDYQHTNSISCKSLYYPSSFNPHKGHALLLESLLRLHYDGVNFKLILTGSGTSLLQSLDPLDNPDLEKARNVYQSAPLSFKHKVEVLGRVSDQQLDICFAHADLVVLPSKYEGFGLPLVEAVARGKQVLCADIPAFREQVVLFGFSQAVSFVEAPSITSWSAALQSYLQKPLSSPYCFDHLKSIFARRTWSHVATEYLEAFVH